MQLTTEQQGEIAQRIKQIEAERERFISEANRQLGAFDGALQTLKALLAPTDVVKDV